MMNSSLNITLLILIGFASKNAAAHDYRIEKVSDHGHYIINGMSWQPHEACPHINKGDKVSFVHGNANGKCVSATIAKKSSDSSEPCHLWCSDATDHF